MVFELESLVAEVTLEFPQLGTLVMRHDMSLQSMNVLELFVAYFAVEFFM